MSRRPCACILLRSTRFVAPPRLLKILAIQFKRIGDLILTTPALAALRKKFPDAHVTLAVENGCRDLLPALDFVDEHLVFNRTGGNAKLWTRVLFGHFDVALDFTGTDRSVLFAVLSKARRRVTFQWIAKSKVRAIFFDTLVDSSVRENHTADHYCDLLRALDIDARGTPVTLNLPAWTQKKAEQLLQEIGCAEPFVIVHPGTARLEKFWRPERWATVVDFIIGQLKMPCVLTAGSDPMEREHIEKIKAASRAPLLRKASVIASPSQLRRPGEPVVHDVTGRLDLLTLGALAKRARLFLSVDSGPMHLASAFGTPQVALFGPTNPFHWRPRHERAVVVQAGVPETGAPLKPHHDAAPMEELSTQQVIGAIKSLLAR